MPIPVLGTKYVPNSKWRQEWAQKYYPTMTVPESLPKGLFAVSAITLLGSFSLTVLLFVLPTMTGIRDGRLFSSGSFAEFLQMRCFLSASSLNEERLPLSLFKQVTLRTGILDFRWTEERRTLSPSISRLLDAIAFYNCGFWHRAITTTFSKLFLCFVVWFFSAFANFLFGLSVKNITILLLRISMLTAPIAEANDWVLSKIHGNRLLSFRHKQLDIGHTCCSIARAQRSQRMLRKIYLKRSSLSFFKFVNFELTSCRILLAIYLTYKTLQWTRDNLLAIVAWKYGKNQTN